MDPLPQRKPSSLFLSFPYLLFTNDTQVGLRVKCERETGREVRFESLRVEGS